MIGIGIKFINIIISLFGSILNVLFGLLPNSPFDYLLNSNSVVSQYFKYINYFIPIDGILLLLEGWLGCLAAYYIYKISLRWIKAIK